MKIIRNKIGSSNKKASGNFSLKSMLFKAKANPDKAMNSIEILKSSAILYLL